jgi:hypothetical protein
MDKVPIELLEHPCINYCQRPQADNVTDCSDRANMSLLTGEVPVIIKEETLKIAEVLIPILFYLVYQKRSNFLHILF